MQEQVRVKPRCSMLRVQKLVTPLITFPSVFGENCYPQGSPILPQLTRVSLETSCFLSGPKYPQGKAGTFDSQGCQQDLRQGRPGCTWSDLFGWWYPQSSHNFLGFQGKKMLPPFDSLLSVSPPLPEQGPQDGVIIFCSFKSGRFGIISQP